MSDAVPGHQHVPATAASADPAIDELLSTLGPFFAPPNVGSACYLYRQACPSAPCGGVPGAVANPARRFACTTLATSSAGPATVGNATVPAAGEWSDAYKAALAAPSAILGAVIAFLLTMRYGRGFLQRGAARGGDSGAPSSGSSNRAYARVDGPDSQDTAARQQRGEEPLMAGMSRSK
jgi:hypothetical protein